MKQKKIFLLFASVLMVLASGCGNGGKGSPTLLSDVNASSGSNTPTESTGTADPPSTTTTSNDPNGSFETAANITAGVPMNSGINPAGDLDYYKFTTICTGAITADLTGLSSDLVLKLYNGSRTEMGISDLSGSQSEHISYNASTVGTFYILVKGYNGATGGYTLNVTIPGPCGTPPPGGTTTGNTGTNPGAAGDISFTLIWSWTGSSRTAGPDIDLWVTDPLGHMLSTSRDGWSFGPEPEGGIIDYDDLGGWSNNSSCTGNEQCDGGGPERAYWPTGQAPAGTYTYGVRYYAGDGTASYTLRVYKGTALIATKTGTLTTPSINRVTVGTVVN